MIDKRNSSPKAADLLGALDLFFPEAAYATFWEIDVEGEDKKVSRDSFSRIDFWAISLWNLHHPHEHPASTTVAVEVKVDRSDFLQELKRPQKQRWALMYSNLFYYCTPLGLIRNEELPPHAGLLEYENDKITETIKAPWREAMAPKWTFVASILNHLRRKIKEERQKH